MLYGLKNISETIDTLALLDSNARGILGEHIDGNGRKVCLRQIGGLCCAATTQALRECKPRYPKIKNIYNICAQNFPRVTTEEVTYLCSLYHTSPLFHNLLTFF